jgi:hypothetical protein
LELDIGTNIVLFGEMSSGLMKLFGHNENCYVWRKNGRLASRRIPSQTCSMGAGRLCEYNNNLKTSVKKLKLGCKWFFQMDNDPMHTSKVVAKWFENNKVKVLEWPSTKP